MFVYLLPVLLIFGLVISENSTNITVQVSSNGSDTPSCIQDNTSCKTMLYVLNQISLRSKGFHRNTSITVNITCNQIIKTRPHFNFASSFPLSIRVIGHNNTSIVFKNFFSGLIITQKSKSKFNWAWIGFKIFTHYLFPSSMDHTNMNSLLICNCKIMFLRLSISYTRNVIIDSTEFGSNFGQCPSIHVMVNSEPFRSSITFSNNNFSNCEILNYLIFVSFNTIDSDSSLSIINCTFMKMRDYHDQINNNHDARIISVKTQKHACRVTINGSRFIGNNKVKILTVNAFPKKDHEHIPVILHGLVIINNTETSELVKMNWHANSIGGVDS